MSQLVRWYSQNPIAAQSHSLYSRDDSDRSDRENCGSSCSQSTHDVRSIPLAVVCIPHIYEVAQHACSMFLQQRTSKDLWTVDDNMHRGRVRRLRRRPVSIKIATDVGVYVRRPADGRRTIRQRTKPLKRVMYACRTVRSLIRSYVSIRLFHVKQRTQDNFQPRPNRTNQDPSSDPSISALCPRTVPRDHTSRCIPAPLLPIFGTFALGR
jgi:hypothetical protein